MNDLASFTDGADIYACSCPWSTLCHFIFNLFGMMVVRVCIKSCSRSRTVAGTSMGPELRVSYPLDGFV